MTSACSMACRPSAVIRPGSPGPAPASQTQPFSNAGKLSASARARCLCKGVGLTILRPKLVNDSISQFSLGNNREFVTQHSSYMDQACRPCVARFSRTAGENAETWPIKSNDETQIRPEAQHVRLREPAA